VSKLIIKFVHAMIVKHQSTNQSIKIKNKF